MSRSIDNAWVRTCSSASAFATPANAGGSISFATAARLTRAAEDSFFHLRGLDPGPLHRSFRSNHAHVGSG